MRALIACVALILGACVGTPRAPMPPGALVILVTVESSERLPLAGAPSRLFGYAGNYLRPASIERVFDGLARDYDLERADAWPIASLGVYCQAFVVRSGRIDDVVAQLTRDTRVESAQAMNEFQTLAAAGDPYRDLQDSLEPLDISAAHRLSTGRNVSVAVIDTGVDARHPDLAGRVQHQQHVLPRHQAAPDVHGTGIAGVIAARGGNGEGILGVAPDARIVALTACWRVDDGGRCNSFTLARALDAAIARDVDVINLSLSGPSDPLLARLVRRALDAGIAVVGACDPVHRNAFPGGIDGVIEVAALLEPGGTLRAPGSEVLTTVPGGSYDFLSGNSLAAAHVSGVIALALAADPSLTNGALRKRLEASSSPVTGVNACAALDGLDGQRCVTSRRSD